MSADIIGKKVWHRINKMLGEIVAVSGNIVTISFRGEIQKYEYPAAFSSVLEIEDEEEQKLLENEGIVDSFNNFKRVFLRAIGNEVSYIKSTGGEKHRAVDGECISSERGEYIYLFDVDSEYQFPDGTPIKIWLPEAIVPAYVISCEDFTIMFRTAENLGYSLSEIEFTSEQWFLLEALMERLDAMEPAQNSIAYELAVKGRSQINPMKKIICGPAAAIRRATSEKITFIWGPPGTGKTETLSNIALDYIESGKRVLMLSYSNVSVDGALLRLAKKYDGEPGQVIRYGYPRVKELMDSKTLSSFMYVLHQNPAVAAEYYDLVRANNSLKKQDPRRKKISDRINEIRKSLREKEKDVVQNAAFVATTVSKAVIDTSVYGQSFDVVIFDEASMAYVPQIVFAGGLAKKAFVCLGDFRQLPAIVQDESVENLQQDIFEYTGITETVENDEGHEWLVLLNTQYRMHPEISRFVSTSMYGGLLKTSQQIIEQRKEIANLFPFAGDAMGLIDLSGTYSTCIKTLDGSRVNLLSAFLSVRMAESYASQYEVGIITPYKAQARLLMAMLRDLQEKSSRYKMITCATVHQFQGSEKSIIIYDAVDCYRMKYVGPLLTKLKNNTANRLFNVALTRAKGKFILVANKDFYLRKKLSPKLMFERYMNLMVKSKTSVNVQELATQFKGIDGKYQCYINGKDDSWKEYLSDIENAQREVCIDVPGVMDGQTDIVGELSNVLRKADESQIAILLRTSDDVVLPYELSKWVTMQGYVTTPITIIDRKIIWFGHPMCAADFLTEGEVIETVHFPCTRFEGIHTARMIKAIYGI